MGKKTRKTRWRTLAIADESDSEESNTLSGPQLSKSYTHRQFYSKFTYSSQSTPTKRFPYEPKSTRSSSTASENKITFNEDEYTKITTPRQDVLFKKGYLSKPKNYQTQTSTGNSTASTGNSTGNGTPDHQSADGTEGTDLEYESQFVFPNAFVDQNGIYYINSYEHYPLVMYNPPICYPEYPLSRSKRHSTGSLTESTSPHTEETSQDLSQSSGENTGTGPEFNHVYNVVYPGYYFNGVCSPNAATNGQAATEPRKIKKKRRRKISKTLNQDETTSSEDGYSSDEAITQVENRIKGTKNAISTAPTDAATNADLKSDEDVASRSQENEAENIPDETGKEVCEDKDVDEDSGTIDLVGDSQNENDAKDTDDSSSSKEGIKEDEKVQEEMSAEDESIKNDNELEPNSQEPIPDNNQIVTPTQETISDIVLQKDDTTITIDATENFAKESKFNLNAEEFIPRAYRPIPIDPNLQFINIHPNFVPLSLINHPLNDIHAPPFNPPFLPPGIPLNFVTADPKLLPNFVNFVPNHFVPSTKPYEQPPNEQAKIEETKDEEEATEKPKEQSECVEEACEVKTETRNQEEHLREPERIDMEKTKNLVYKNDVDIAKIVSKLEEAAKEQKFYENRHQNYRSPNKFNKTPRQRFNSPYQNDYRQDSYRQPYDKRKPRRFEPKPTENTDAKPVDTSSVNTNLTRNDNNKSIQTKSEEIQTDPQTKTEPKEIPFPKPTEDDRKYSPRHHNYQNTNSPRKFINYNNRSSKSRTPEHQQNASYSAPNTEYSDTKSNYTKSCPRFEKYTTNKMISTPNKINVVRKQEETRREVLKTSTLNRTSQWIPVSSKKKRKNKSSNEEDCENLDDNSEILGKVNEIPLELTSEEQKEEQIDVPVEITTEHLSFIKIDNIIEMIAHTASSPIQMCSHTNIPDGKIQLQDVKDIERELLKDSAKADQVDQIDFAPTQNESLQSQTKTTKEAQKKKTKKGNIKSNTKRIIIVDPDVSKTEIEKTNKIKPETEIELPITHNQKSKDSENINEATPKPEENVSKSSEAVSIDKISEIISEEKIPECVVPTPIQETTEILTTPDKKKSKKKKKQAKANVSTSIPSISSSSTTLNQIDDSYDFLLDTSLVDDKTNIEVSEELDKMIQKGLFGNLEEKFRSLNVSVDDDFFKSLNLKPKTQSTPEKGYIKATNFTTILNNANQALPRMKFGDDPNKIDVDFSKIQLPEYEPQPSTSRTGIFLEKSVESETGPPAEPIQNVSNTKSNGKLKNKSKKNTVTDEISNNKVVLKNENLTGNEENASKTDEVDVNLNLDDSKIKEGNDGLKDDFFPKQNMEIEQWAINLENRKDEKENHSNPMEEQLVENIIDQDIGEVSETIKLCDINNYENNENKPITENTNAVIENLSKTGSQNEIPKLMNGCAYLNDVIKIQHMDLEPNLKIDISLATEDGTVVPETADCDIDNNIFKNDQSTSQFKISNDECIIVKIEESLGEDEAKEDDILTESNISLITGTAEVTRNLKSKNSHDNSSLFSIELKPLYPITQAVKEWMTKTRETTPEIEILKSPDTIYKEFIEDSDDDSDTERDQKNARSNPSPVDCLDQQDICSYSMGERVATRGVEKSEISEDDLTVCETWSMSQDTSLQEDDLLDCWEPDLIEAKKEEPVEQGEDVLELIETKYGKNEDFLRLKAEIEEQKRNGTFPKHGDLPYRAICCSLM